MSDTAVTKIVVDEGKLSSTNQASDHPKLRDLEIQITQIEGESKVTAVRLVDRASGEERSLPADGVFIEIGGVPNSDPVKGLARLTDYGELVIDCSCRTSVPGLFGAGDVTTVPYKQIVVSAGEGSKAALAAYDYLVARGML